MIEKKNKILRGKGKPQTTKNAYENVKDLDRRLSPTTKNEHCCPIEDQKPIRRMFQPSVRTINNHHSRSPRVPIRKTGEIDEIRQEHVANDVEQTCENNSHNDFGCSQKLLRELLRNPMHTLKLVRIV